MKRTILSASVILLMCITFSLKGQAQDFTKLPRFGQDSVQAVTKLSLYQEFYQQWRNSNYKNNSIHDALKSWRWLIGNAPRCSENLYINGGKMYHDLMAKEKQPQRKKEILDTLMLLYDYRIKYFPETRKGEAQEGRILGFKGIDLYLAAPEKYSEVYDILNRSVELMGNKSQSATLVYLFRTTIQKVNNNKAEKSLILENYDRIAEIIEYNIEHNKNDEKELRNWNNVKGNIENSFEPYATCEDIISIFKTKFEANPTDYQLLEKITSLLDKKACHDDDFYFVAIEALHKLKPTPQSARKMGRMLYFKQDYDNSIAYLLEAADLFEDNHDKADVYKMLAGIFQVKKDFRQARNYAKKVIGIIPESGTMYILIGDMYATTAAECGSDDLTSKAAYWAAVDKYNKAKQVDNSVSEEANKRIRTYSQYFPKKETLFWHSLKEGDSYDVECWINEKTTIRAAK